MERRLHRFSVDVVCIACDFHPNSYNHKMFVLSVIFLASSWYLTGKLGSVGFILANCLNMAVRITHRFGIKLVLPSSCLVWRHSLLSAWKLSTLWVQIYCFSVYYVRQFYLGSSMPSPLAGLLPSPAVAVMYVAAFVLTMVSEVCVVLQNPIFHCTAHSVFCHLDISTNQFHSQHFYIIMYHYEQFVHLQI